MTLSRCSLSSLIIFSWFLLEKSSSRQSSFQWVRIVSLFSSTSFCIHTKRNSFNFCSQQERNSISFQSHSYIDDVLFINNQDFGNYLSQMYPVELEIKNTTCIISSASDRSLLLSIGMDGQLHTSIRQTR